MGPVEVWAAGRPVESARTSWGPAGLRPVVRGPGWYLIDSCWIELDAVRQVLDGVLTGRPHLVVPVPDAVLGHRLDCHVATANWACRWRTRR